MEFEQIVKRLEWLDEEHRKDKAALNEFEDKISEFESGLDTLSKQIKQANKKLSDLGSISARLNQFDDVLSKERADMNKALSDIEKKYRRRDKERHKQHQGALEETNKTVATLSKGMAGLKKKIKDRSDDILRLDVTLTEMKQTVEDTSHRNEEIFQSQKLIGENRRKDIKQISDLQGEITAVRKRMDDFREKTDLQAENLRNIESRFSELMASEAERNKAQSDFLNQQNLSQVERDHVYKEWREKFDTFNEQLDSFDTQTQTLDETLRAAKRAQDTYLELNQKLERRINEVTEMQRLAEDRLRQEWVAFKSDDQKRWTGYALSQEEALRDVQKDVDKIEERLTAIDDSSQNLSDQFLQTTDITEKQLQELMNIAHEWLTSYERIMGQGPSSK